jgi:O-methyltransferase domain/Dimerisation domain
MSPPGEPQGEDVARAQAALQQMTNGYWVTQIVYVAARLGIADLLKDGPRTIAELARSTKTHAPTLYRVMPALSGLGVFRENDDGTFEATILGRCLASGSPGALRAREIMNGEEWYRAWGGLLESLRTGETAFDHIFGVPFFEYLSAHAGSAALFNEAMASSTELAASAVAEVYDFSGAGTIVDVGGGTGAFLAGILMANPQARGILFDRPDVVADASGILTGAGVASRCAVIAGDFLEAVPSGGGAYILSWIIHDWDDDRAVTILKNCRRAMADDARLLILEQVLPRGNEPSLSKLYGLHMLVLYRGRERREDEYRALLAAANLQLARVIPTGVPRSVIEALPR